MKNYYVIFSWNLGKAVTLPIYLLLPQYLWEFEKKKMMSHSIQIKTTFNFVYWVFRTITVKQCFKKQTITRKKRQPDELIKKKRLKRQLDYSQDIIIMNTFIFIF